MIGLKWIEAWSKALQKSEKLELELRRAEPKPAPDPENGTESGSVEGVTPVGNISPITAAVLALSVFHYLLTIYFFLAWFQTSGHTLSRKPLRAATNRAFLGP